MPQPHADGLGRVDGGSAAHREDKVYPLGLAQFDPLVDQAQPRVGLHAAQADERDPLRLQRSLYTIQQAGLFSALAAVMQQHLAAAPFFDQRAHLLLAVLAKDDLCRRIEIKAFHNSGSFRTLDY